MCLSGSPKRWEQGIQIYDPKARSKIQHSPHPKFSPSPGKLLSYDSSSSLDTDEELGKTIQNPFGKGGRIISPSREYRIKRGASHMSFGSTEREPPNRQSLREYLGVKGKNIRKVKKGRRTQRIVHRCKSPPKGRINTNSTIDLLERQFTANASHLLATTQTQNNASMKYRKQKRGISPILSAKPSERRGLQAKYIGAKQKAEEYLGKLVAERQKTAYLTDKIKGIEQRMVMKKDILNMVFKMKADYEVLVANYRNSEQIRLKQEETIRSYSHINKSNRTAASTKRIKKDNNLTEMYIKPEFFNVDRKKKKKNRQ